MRHLIDILDLSTDEVQKILDLGERTGHKSMSSHTLVTIVMGHFHGRLSGHFSHSGSRIFRR